MELVDYLRLLRRRAAYLIVATLAGLGGGFAVTASQTSDYSVTVRLYVSTASSADVGQLIDNVAQVATSAPVTAAATSNATGSASFSISSGQQGGSSVVGLIITSSDAARATSVATAYAQVLPGALKKFDPRNQANLQLLDQSSPSQAPVHRLRTWLLGALVGLFVGFAAALLREALDRSIRSTDELSRFLGRPTVAVIPGDGQTSGIALLKAPQSPRSEAYRRLGAYTRASAAQVRTLVVTSAVAREGKTATAVNLVSAAAQAGDRAVLVDANLRRPSVASVLGEKEGRGLSDLLAGDVELAAVLRSSPAGHFDFISAGAPTDQAVELLDGEAFRVLLEDLRGSYDLVVIDAPAMLGVADAEIVAGVCDAVVFVARLGSTQRALMRRSVETLERTSAPIWAVVANFSDEAEPVPRVPKARRVVGTADRKPPVRTAPRVPRPAPATVPSAEPATATATDSPVAAGVPVTDPPSTGATDGPVHPVSTAPPTTTVPLGTRAGVDDLLRAERSERASRLAALRGNASAAHGHDGVSTGAEQAAGQSSPRAVIRLPLADPEARTAAPTEPSLTTVQHHRSDTTRERPDVEETRAGEAQSRQAPAEREPWPLQP